MRMLWKYLRPHEWLAVLSMLLAAAAQALNFFDLVIFGRIIDQYALNPGNKTEQELIQGIPGFPMIFLSKSKQGNRLYLSV